MIAINPMTIPLMTPAKSSLLTEPMSPGLGEFWPSDKRVTLSGGRIGVRSISLERASGENLA